MADHDIDFVYQASADRASTTAAHLLKKRICKKDKTNKINRNVQIAVFQIDSALFTLKIV